MTQKPKVHSIDFGDFLRLKPISRNWGFNRGFPIDRYYIENFLRTYATEIRGQVLEVSDDKYTRKFGGSRVVNSEILDISTNNPKATIIADLSMADHIADNTFDCIICTQTMQFIYDMKGAIKTLYRIMKPGGTLLATMPGISQISRYDIERWGDYWRLTSLSTRKLFFDPNLTSQLQVKAFGNVLAAISFLHGISADELSTEELDFVDPDYELIIMVRAVKA